MYILLTPTLSTFKRGRPPLRLFREERVPGVRLQREERRGTEILPCLFFVLVRRRVYQNCRTQS